MRKNDKELVTTKCRLSPVALGLALGVFWGVVVFIMGLVDYYFMFGDSFVTSMGTIYIGYKTTIIGSLIGGAIGFIHALIGGIVVSWLYNVFSGCCCRKDGKCD